MFVISHLAYSLSRHLALCGAGLPRYSFTVNSFLSRSLFLPLLTFLAACQVAPGGAPVPYRRGSPLPVSFPSNGAQIYFTATNWDGRPIPYSGGPNFGGMMMGTYLTCASCHGADGSGGRHVMHMWVMDAPPISYRALQELEHEEMSGAMEEYTLETFRLAVVEGKHPDGETLNPNMPRWRLDDRDLSDLFEFLKTLP